ncbi:MAG: hypothetical protein ABIM89_05735 [Mycobacteriales bacterium]
MGRMFRAGSLIGARALSLATCVVSLTAFISCGGGSTGNPRDSGVDKTFLAVEAGDADGDSLPYQWRVTAGSIVDTDAANTVWTMAAAPGIHFAYVITGLTPSSDCLTIADQPAKVKIR